MIKNVIIISGFVFLGLLGCKNRKVILEQIELIKNVTPESVESFQYYDNGVIRYAATENDKGILKGKILEFYDNGDLKKMFVRNEIGAKVGDESYFVENKLKEHVFRKDKWTVLFYASFNEEQKIDSVDGNPYFVYCDRVVNEGDTASFSISTAIIPYHKTMVTFGDDSLPETIVEYENTLGQYTYLFIPSWDKGKYDFKLKVNIIDSSGNVRVSDSTNIELKVLSK